MGKPKKEFEPNIIADEQVDFEGAEKPEDFTNFEDLMKRVEILQDVINEHTEILRQNNLVYKQETEAPYFDEDEVYKKLEEEKNK